MTNGANGSARRSAATDSGCADGKSAPNTWNSCSIATRSDKPVRARSASIASRNNARGQQRHAVPSRRSEEHTSELQSLMRISYAVFCLKQKKEKQPATHL